MKKSVHIAFFVLFAFWSANLVAQDEFDVDQYLDEVTIGYEYEQSPAHQEYLKSEIEIEAFDKAKWERLRMNIVNHISGVEYEGQDGSGFTREDNPYNQSQRSFQRYWRERNAKEIKRLPKEKSEYQPRENNRDNIFNSGAMSPFLSGIIMVVIVLAFAALVFFLFFNQIKDGKGNKKIARDLDAIIPTEIPKTELELLLEKALAKEDYREAIRVYFIFVIRGLIHEGAIEWEKEKTNFSYLNEMRENKHYSSFEACVSVYEIVWYGERQLSKQEYQEVEPRFKTLVKKLDE